MSAHPPWRSIAPRSPIGRIAALFALAVGAALAAAFVAAPLIARMDDARDRAARLDARTAALTAAATARRAEAAGPPADPAAIAAASDWLRVHAPLRTAEAAALDLLSALRLTAEATGVELASAAPLSQTGRDPDLFAAADMAGLAATAAEARIVADHAGLARFLGALEAAEPALRAAAIEITARSSGAAAEARRLTARVIVGALSRAPGG